MVGNVGGANTGGKAKTAAASPSTALRPRQRLVLQALAWSTGLTRAALADQVGLPKATLAGLVGSLIDSGLVVEGPARAARGPGAGHAGRPPRLLSLAGPASAAGAVVYSGGTLTAAVVSYAGEILGRAASRVGNRDVDTGIVRAGIELLAEATAASDVAPEQIKAVVLGIPAPLGLVADQVAGELGQLVAAPTLLENDANLGALGEATFGAGRDLDTFLFLKLARGVGAGLIVGKRLHRGATGYAGELGHVQVSDDGPLCSCGGRGCLHGILGDALVRAVQPAYEQTLTFGDVLDLAAHGDPGPRRVLEDTGRTVGRPLADFATLFNPEAIVVDGSFAPAVQYVIDGIRESIDRYSAPVASGAVSVMAGSLGDDADVLGAAALARTTVH